MKIRGFQIAALSVAIAGSAACFSGPLLAQSADESFAKEAAMGGMAEVKLGQLAKQKGVDVGVKEFGNKMVTDHSKADDRLKEVASKNKIALPTEISNDDHDTYERLSKLSGPEFDKVYAEDMLRDHEKDVAAFKKEASSGKNPDLRKFASETLPTLEGHLQMAQHLENTEKNTSAAR